MLKGLLHVLARRVSARSWSENTVAAEQRVAEALQRYQGGDAAAADALCRAALALDQRQARAWSLLARIALELDTGTTVALRLSSEEAVHIAKKLLAFAARDVGLKVEGAFEPLVNLANRLGRALEK